MFHLTRRLLLRPAWPEDADKIFDAMSDPTIAPNIARAPWPYSREDALWFASQEQDPLVPGFLLFELGKPNARLVGSAGLGLVDAEAGDSRVQIGYWIAKDFRQRGYASEAGRAVLEIARTLGHRRILGQHFVDNPASGRVLRSIGFVPTGRRPLLKSRARAVPASAIEYALDLEAEASPNAMSHSSAYRPQHSALTSLSAAA